MKIYSFCNTWLPKQEVERAQFHGWMDGSDQWEFGDDHEIESLRKSPYGIDPAGLATIGRRPAMTEAPQPIENRDLDNLTRFIHLGLTVFGILALISGLWAGDYKRALDHRIKTGALSIIEAKGINRQVEDPVIVVFSLFASSPFRLFPPIFFPFTPAYYTGWARCPAGPYSYSTAR